MFESPGWNHPCCQTVHLKTHKWVERSCIAWRAFKVVRRFLENFQYMKTMEETEPQGEKIEQLIEQLISNTSNHRKK